MAEQPPLPPLAGRGCSPLAPPLGGALPAGLGGLGGLSAGVPIEGAQPQLQLAQAAAAGLTLAPVLAGGESGGMGSHVGLGGRVPMPPGLVGVQLMQPLMPPYDAGSAQQLAAGDGSKRKDAPVGSTPGRRPHIEAPNVIEEPPLDFVPLLEAGLPDLRRHYEHVFKKPPGSANADWMRDKLKKAYESAGIAVEGDESRRPQKRRKAEGGIPEPMVPGLGTEGDMGGAMVGYPSAGYGTYVGVATGYGGAGDAAAGYGSACYSGTMPVALSGAVGGGMGGGPSPNYGGAAGGQLVSAAISMPLVPSVPMPSTVGTNVGGLGIIAQACSPSLTAVPMAGGLASCLPGGSDVAATQPPAALTPSTETKANKKPKAKRTRKDRDGTSSTVQGRPVKIVIPAEVPQAPPGLPHPLHCNIRQLRGHFQHIFKTPTSSGNSTWLKKKLCTAYGYDPNVVPPMPPVPIIEPQEKPREPREKRQPAVFNIKVVSGSEHAKEVPTDFEIRIRKDATVATLKKRIQEISKGKIHPRSQTLKSGADQSSEIILTDDDKALDTYGMTDHTLSLAIEARDTVKRVKKVREPRSPKGSKVAQAPVETAGKNRKPRMEEDELIVLIDGVNQHGINQWKAIKENNPFKYNRTPQELKDKWRNLVRVCGVEGQEVPGGKIQRLRTILPREKWDLVSELSSNPNSKAADAAMPAPTTNIAAQAAAAAAARTATLPVAPALQVPAVPGVFPGAMPPI